MASTSDARTLAAALAQRTDADLAQLFERRGTSPDAEWRDFFDAADALLSAASIDRALASLTVASVEAMRSLAPDTTAIEWMLTSPDGRPYDVVGARLADRAKDVAEISALPTAASAEPASPAAAAAAAERAFTAVGAIGDLVLWALAAPIGRTGAGTVAANDRRRLVEAGTAANADELEDLIALAAAAGLIGEFDREWQTTSVGDSWLDTRTADRWTAIAEGFVRSLRPGLRTAEGGHLPLPTWAGAFPLDPTWEQTAGLLRRRAWRAGLLADDDTEPAWARSLRVHGAAETEALLVLLPREIDHVYLQADLSAIAPGPLEPALERRLCTMAVRESRAQASTYRFSADSIAAAIAAGETAQSLRSFLTELSRTGIPQPLGYLIDRAMARHAVVRVGVDPETGHALVTSKDADLLAMVGVDHALRPVGLVPHDGSLISRAAPEAVYWSLFDARYPVVSVDAAGSARTPRRHPASPSSPPRSPLERYARLLSDLRSGSGPDAEAAWLERELERAVRTRAVIEVAVRLPDGSTRSFTLEATGLGGGRLRGRDRHADVERTLPVANIVSAGPPASG